MDRIGGGGVPTRQKLKTVEYYFSLAKEEMDKAFRAEINQCSLNDVVQHYQNAMRLLAKALPSPPPPSYLSSSRCGIKSTTTEPQNGRIALTTEPQNGRIALTTEPQNGRIALSTEPQNGKIALTTSQMEVNLFSNCCDDAKLVEMINSMIVDHSSSVKLEDIVGPETAKQKLEVNVILPTIRRDFFTGMRKPAKGLLLFGPPGTETTMSMLAQAAAAESEATFFNVPSYSLNVRHLLLTLSLYQIDSIFSASLASEDEDIRMLMSEFRTQFDWVVSNDGVSITVIGATNKPQDLDAGVLRRLGTRIYIPLPDADSRRLFFKQSLIGPAFSLPDTHIERLVEETNGFSVDGLQELCSAASMVAIKELGERFNTTPVRGLKYEDFQRVMPFIRPSLQESFSPRASYSSTSKNATSAIGQQDFLDSCSYIINGTNVSNSSSSLIFENIGVLDACDDEYDGVVVSPEKLPSNPNVFASTLRSSMCHWKIKGKKGVWLKLPIERSDLVPIAVKEGFEYHHAEKSYVMLTYWIPDGPCLLPPNASHHVGVGGFVLNDKDEVLVVQEKHCSPNLLGLWKIPTGFIHENEEIYTGAVREVKEETGIDTEFVEVVSFRHAKNVSFEKSDLFFVCMLRPLSTAIVVDDLEIQAAKWMPLDEFVNQPLIQGDSMFKKIFEMCVARLGKRYCGLSVHQLVSKFDDKLSSLYFNIVEDQDPSCPAK
ncbi:hypothetical protein RD792_009178 [Penstemon davidsonii]|uniref:Nudix hydrolase domain-containing protein n=1 Tax=Penstemon davidsonii TaxID=160366 RepID=A0ABR0DB62_9LAMI|nr:hypothetical protein RD792_009178 [Penstemon davidsonii]